MPIAPKYQLKKKRKLGHLFELNHMIILLWVLILCIPTFFFIARPIFRRDQTTILADNSNILAQVIDREQYYGALADLEEDHEVGKISAEDYNQLKQLLLQETVEILQKVDLKEKKHQSLADSPPVLLETVFAEAEIEIEKYKRTKQ